MKTIIRSIALVLFAIFAFSCVEEIGDYTTNGEVQFTLITPTALVDSLDYTVRAKLYREYSDETVVLELDIEDFNGDTVTTETGTLSYGYWEVQTVNIIQSKLPIYVAVDIDDERAEGMDEDLLIPMSDNVLLDQTTMFTVSLVKMNVIAKDYYAYDFESGADQYDAIEDDWTTIDAESNASRYWGYSSPDEDNQYARMSAYAGTSSTYASWLISPPLDLDAATEKVVSFKTSVAYYSEETTFKVYILDKADTTGTRVELDANLPTEFTAEGEFIVSGDLDLSAYSGTKYIAFYYQSAPDDAATYGVDDFLFGEASGNTVEPEVISIAQFLTLEDGETASIKGVVTEVSVSESYGTVTYMMIKDSNGDEIKAYGVWRISETIYEVGQTLILTGERDNYNGEDEIVFYSDSGHSIQVVEGDGNSTSDEYPVADFLALADGEVGTVQGVVTEVSVSESYGTVTYLVIEDSNGDEIKAYGVYRISDIIYEVGQTLKITGERDNYNGEDQIAFSSDAGHSIEIIEGDGSTTEDYLISDFLALEDGEVGTVKGEVTEVSVNASYGTVTYVVIKDSNGDELKAYGVYRVSDVIYEVGQTLLITGERDNYSGEDQLAFSSDAGHSIEIVE